MSTYEVWGSNPGGYDTSAIDTITRQLDYYKAAGTTVSNKIAAKKTNGASLAYIMYEQVNELNVDFAFEEVIDVNITENEKIVTTNDNKYTCKYANLFIHFLIIHKIPHFVNLVQLYILSYYLLHSF